jgi:methionine-gamma-lyase
MAAHSMAVDYLVRRLEKEGIWVMYPGLEGHSHHAFLRGMMNPGFGFGGMMALDCGTVKKAMTLASRLQQEKFGLYAVSLGFSRTLMSCPSVSTSSEIPEDEQKKMQLSPGMLRLSIGFTGRDEILFERFMRCYREVR